MNKLKNFLNGGSLVGAAFFCFLISCSQPPKGEVDAEANTSWHGEVGEMAELNCQSITLRKERFALADSIRALEEGVLETSSDDARIAHWNQRMSILLAQKEILGNESVILADSIRKKLNASLMALPPNDKRAFNDSLKLLLQQLGCDD